MGVEPWRLVADASLAVQKWISSVAMNRTRWQVLAAAAGLLFVFGGRPLTERIDTQVHGQCIAVVHNGTTYLANRVERSRWTGDLMLKMRGSQIPYSEAQITTCANDCLVSVGAQNACVSGCAGDLECARSCGIDNLALEATPPTNEPGQTSPFRYGRHPLADSILGAAAPSPTPFRNYFPLEAINQPMRKCESACLADRIRFAGRDLELHLVDAISNPAQCSCGGASRCVDR